MFLKPLGVLFGLLGTLLEGSWGDLGPSWGEIGWSWKDFWVTSIFAYFLERFWEPRRPPRCITNCAPILNGCWNDFLSMFTRL